MVLGSGVTGIELLMLYTVSELLGALDKLGLVLVLVLGVLLTAALLPQGLFVVLGPSEFPHDAFKLF